MRNLILSVIMDTSKYGSYLGTSDTTLFWSCIFFGYLGVLLMILYSLSKRNVTSTRSPVEFQWSFFWKDNNKRILLNLILVAVCIRFIPQLTGKEMSQWLALLIGIGSDKLGEFLMKKKDALLGDASTVVVTTTPAANTQVDATVTVKSTPLQQEGNVEIQSSSETTEETTQ